jgi:hypothetical protein
LALHRKNPAIAAIVKTARANMTAGARWWRPMKYPGLAITVYNGVPSPVSARPVVPNDHQGSARDRLGGQMQDDLWTRPVRPYQRAAADV